MKVYGDYHTHTVASDGHSTVDENIAAAKIRGLQAVAITDHAHRLPHNKQKRNEHNLRQKKQAYSAGAVHGIQTLYGVECNIVGTHGEIDVPEDERKMYDVLICGFHMGAKPKRFHEIFTHLIPNLFWFVLHRLHLNFTPKRRLRKNTQAVINAIEQNNIDILSHPNRYFRVNILEVAQACVARGTAMELNNKRISFRPIDFERMAKMGVKFVINSDAHYAANIGQMDRVEAFLKLCDYDPACLLNVNQAFARPRGALLGRIVEAENATN